MKTTLLITGILAFTTLGLYLTRATPHSIAACMATSAMTAIECENTINQ